MYAYADDAQRFRSAGLGVECSRVADRYAKLVLVKSGRDVRMSLRGHIRIYAQCNWSSGSQACRALRERPQFRFALHIEQHGAGPQGGSHFFPSFTHTRENYFVSGLAIGHQDTLQLSPGDHVKTAAPPGEQPQNA